jgi:hypothetical protein
LSVPSLCCPEILANATTRKAWWLHYLLNRRLTTYWMRHCYTLRRGTQYTHMPWYLFLKWMIAYTHEFHSYHFFSDVFCMWFYFGGRFECFVLNCPFLICRIPK